MTSLVRYNHYHNNHCRTSTSDMPQKKAQHPNRHLNRFPSYNKESHKTGRTTNPQTRGHETNTTSRRRRTQIVRRS